MHWQHASCCRRVQSLAVRLAISRLMRLICLLSMVQLLLSRQQAKPGGADDDKLQGDALEACLALLEDPEPRVRLAVSECMRLLAELQGITIWLKSRDAILNSIRACWVRPSPFWHRQGSTTACASLCAAHGYALLSGSSLRTPFWRA